MAQLKDTIINGDLTVNGNILGETGADKSIQEQISDINGNINTITENLGTITGTSDDYIIIGNYLLFFGVVEKLTRQTDNLVHAQITLPVTMATTDYQAIITPSYSMNAPYLGNTVGMMAGVTTTSFELRVFSNGLFTTTNLANYDVNARFLVIGRIAQ